MSQHPTYPTSLGVSSVDTISLFGQDLAEELLGQVSFGHLAYRLITLHDRSEICLICHLRRDQASEPPVAGWRWRSCPAWSWCRLRSSSRSTWADP